MKPGATTRPVTSMVSAASSATSPTATMRPSWTADVGHAGRGPRSRRPRCRPAGRGRRLMRAAFRPRTASATTVPSKKSGFTSVKKRTGLVKTKSRKSSSSIRPCSTSSWASQRTSAMSGTSQWAMSEPNTALSRAPNGLAAVSKAMRTIGSSASQPKKNGVANRSAMSSARSMPQAANSSSMAGSSVRRGRAPRAGSRSTFGAWAATSSISSAWSMPDGSRWAMASRLRFSQCPTRSA